MLRSLCCHAKTKEISFDARTENGKTIYPINYGCLKCGKLCRIYENGEKRGKGGRYIKRHKADEIFSMIIGIIFILYVFVSLTFIIYHIL
jgi:hypothetical protein